LKGLPQNGNLCCGSKQNTLPSGGRLMGNIAPEVKFKKKKLMGEAKVYTQEEYEALQRSERLLLIRQLIPIGLMAVAEELQQEINELVSQSIDSKTGKPNIKRHGSNPGSVILGNQRVPIRVPRIRSEQGDINLTSYEFLHNDFVPKNLYKSILNGLSCTKYESTIEEQKGSISKSKSTISRRFVSQSADQLKLIQDRDLTKYDFIAIFIDGKYFCDDEMIIATGITLDGEKKILGFVQSGSENATVIKDFLQSLIDRGLNYDKGLLAVTDGSKGLISGLKQAFSKKVIIQRCQWHKRENIISYLPKSEQEFMRKRLQKAYDRPSFQEASDALKKILEDLEQKNQSAAGSLKEGLNETLALHRLGVFAKLGLSFKTTNCLESINASVEKYCGKIRYWKNSSQKQRWLASALCEIEPNLRHVKGYAHLPDLRQAVQKELGMVS
jgi:putative transposase